MSEYLVDVLTEMSAQIAELQRRMSQMHRRGRIDGIRNGGNEVRIKFGEDEDGNPIHSPWLPVTGSNGQVKSRIRYTQGEHVFVDNVDGDWENAELRPSNHHNEGQSPTQDQDESVIYDDGTVRIAVKNGELMLKSGNSTVVVKNGSVKTTVGGVSHDHTADGQTSTGGFIRHDGKNVGKDHVHGGVDTGNGNTQGPEA